MVDQIIILIAKAIKLTSDVIITIFATSTCSKSTYLNPIGSYFHFIVAFLKGWISPQRSLSQPLSFDITLKAMSS
jgi:hypothetical protein